MRIVVENIKVHTSKETRKYLASVSGRFSPFFVRFVHSCPYFGERLLQYTVYKFRLQVDFSDQLQATDD